MKFTISLFLSVLMMKATPALAQSEAGNGGDGVVCFNQPVDGWGNPLKGSKIPLTITKVSLYDYWEWNEKSNGMKVTLGGKLNYKEKFRFAANRMKTVDIFVSNVLLNAYENQFKDIGFTQDADVPEIYDSYSDIAISNNCYLKQIARQKPTSKLQIGEKRILIDGKLFARLSENEKAMLLLHEYLYTIALAHGSSNSNLLRHYNFMISAESGVHEDRTLYRSLAKDLYLGDSDAYIQLHRTYQALAPLGVNLKKIVRMRTVNQPNPKSRFVFQEFAPIIIGGSSVQTKYFDAEQGTDLKSTQITAISINGSLNHSIAWSDETGVTEFNWTSKVNEPCEINLQTGSSIGCKSVLKYRMSDGATLGPIQFEVQFKKESSSVYDNSIWRFHLTSNLPNFFAAIGNEKYRFSISEKNCVLDALNAEGSVSLFNHILTIKDIKGCVLHLEKNGFTIQAGVTGFSTLQSLVIHSWKISDGYININSSHQHSRLVMTKDYRKMKNEECFSTFDLPYGNPDRCGTHGLYSFLRDLSGRTSLYDGSNKPGSIEINGIKALALSSRIVKLGHVNGLELDTRDPQPFLQGKNSTLSIAQGSKRYPNSRVTLHVSPFHKGVQIKSVSTTDSVALSITTHLGTIERLILRPGETYDYE